MSLPYDTGVVLIGRNEGDRLKGAVAAALTDTDRVCYVDSGSTDDSVAFCREHGVLVVELDMSIPFTAARARNAGFKAIRGEHDGIDFVQFIDGDAELEPGWLTQARDTLDGDQTLATVFGRRRERFPDATVYNRLCDIEWDVPAGDARYCGGDAMFRASAFADVGGFDPGLIAGEEPELCVRLRRAGWKLRSLGTPMTRHDADMNAFSQWFSRMRRAGHAFAEGAVMHGKPPEKHFLRETLQAVFWGAGLPLAAIVLAPVTWGLSIVVALAGYGLSFYRAWKHTLSRGYTGKPALAYAASCVGGKIPQAVGAAELFFNRLTGRRRALIEYKQAD